MSSEYEDRRKVLFLKRGGIEFQHYDILGQQNREGGRSFLKAWEVEADILQALNECASLSEDGLLPLPVLVSVRLLDVGNTQLLRAPADFSCTPHPQEDRHVFLTPVILTSWGDPAREAVRQVIDEMWQAWHQPESTNFYPDGRHHRYDSSGNVVRQQDPKASDVA